ncbi:MAG: hypothetical protein JKY09_06960 [Crocinitomicaceae bacterium]|nr:hypothetical protein [Crocinitomicaceae bacterium]
MNILKKIFIRKETTVEGEMVFCTDFHDGTIRKQSIEASNCVQQDYQLIKIYCASN